MVIPQPTVEEEALKRYLARVVVSETISFTDDQTDEFIVDGFLQRFDSSVQRRIVDYYHEQLESAPQEGQESLLVSLVRNASSSNGPSWSTTFADKANGENNYAETRDDPHNQPHINICSDLQHGRDNSRRIRDELQKLAAITNTTTQDEARLRLLATRQLCRCLGLSPEKITETMIDALLILLPRTLSTNNSNNQARDDSRGEPDGSALVLYCADRINDSHLDEHLESGTEPPNTPRECKFYKTPESTPMMRTSRPRSRVDSPTPSDGVRLAYGYLYEGIKRHQYNDSQCQHDPLQRDRTIEGLNLVTNDRLPYYVVCAPSCADGSAECDPEALGSPGGDAFVHDQLPSSSTRRFRGRSRTARDECSGAWSPSRSGDPCGRLMNEPTARTRTWADFDFEDVGNSGHPKQSDMVCNSGSTKKIMVDGYARTNRCTICPVELSRETRFFLCTRTTTLCKCLESNSNNVNHKHR